MTELSDDCQQALFNNSVQFLHSLSEHVPHSLAILKSYYASKFRILEERGNVCLPESKNRAYARCPRCCLRLAEGSPEYRVRPHKITRFGRQVLNKEARGRRLTRYQEQYKESEGAKLTRNRQNRLVITCSFCKKEVVRTLRKPDKPKPPVVTIDLSKTPGKKKKKKNRKDKSCGLNIETISLLTPKNPNEMETSTPKPVTESPEKRIDTPASNLDTTQNSKPNNGNKKANDNSNNNSQLNEAATTPMKRAKVNHMEWQLKKNSILGDRNQVKNRTNKSFDLNIEAFSLLTPNNSNKMETSTPKPVAELPEKRIDTPKLNTTQNSKPKNGKKKKKKKVNNNNSKSNEAATTPMKRAKVTRKERQLKKNSMKQLKTILGDQNKVKDKNHLSNFLQMFK